MGSQQTTPADLHLPVPSPCLRPEEESNQEHQHCCQVDFNSETNSAISAMEAAASRGSYVPTGSVRILLAGESGLGKTTSIESLFDQDGLFNEPPSRTTRIEEYNFDIAVQHACPDPYSSDILKLTVVDTVGYGDEKDVQKSIDHVVKYIMDRYEHTFKRFSTDMPAQEIKTYLDSPNSPGGHVDFCLFFIPAHRLKAVDLEFMKELSTLVTVIPVIAKADTMTVDELEAFRKECATMIANHNIQCFDISTGLQLDHHEFANEPLSPTSDPRQIFGPPFAIIGSRKTLQNTYGARLRVREYPWGTAFADNPNHCDLAILRQFLFTRMRDIRKETTDKFLQWREQRVKEEKAKKEALDALLRSKAAKEARRNRWLQAASLLCLVLAISLAMGGKSVQDFFNKDREIIPQPSKVAFEGGVIDQPCPLYRSNKPQTFHFNINPFGPNGQKWDATAIKFIPFGAAMFIDGHTSPLSVEIDESQSGYRVVGDVPPSPHEFTVMILMTTDSTIPPAPYTLIPIKRAAFLPEPEPEQTEPEAPSIKDKIWSAASNAYDYVRCSLHLEACS